jgi:valyl-tRNA synthetase
MELLSRLVVALRNLKAELNVPNDKRPQVTIVIQNTDDSRPMTQDSQRDKNELESIVQNRDLIERLAVVGEVSLTAKQERLSKIAVDVVGSFEIYLHLEGMIDLEQEKQRLAKEIQMTEQELNRVNQHLGDVQFLRKAPPEVVEGEKNKRQAIQTRQDRLKQHCSML